MSTTRSRVAALGAAVAVTISAGVGTRHMAAADASNGDRPVFVAISPCRLLDTRAGSDNVGQRAAPLGPDETVTVLTRGSNGECSGASAIPVDALAVQLNVTALRATELTYLSVWGSGDNPGTASLNPAPDQPPTPNAVTTPLSPAGSFELYNERGSVDVVVDVAGYYVGHDHDDRYPTRAEADQRYFTRDAADNRFLTQAEADGHYYSQAEADQRFRTSTQVRDAIDDALQAQVPLNSGSAPSVVSALPSGTCSLDDTDITGIDEACGQAVTVGTPSTFATTVDIDFRIAWYSRGGPATGQCAVYDADADVMLTATLTTMGETVDTTEGPLAVEWITIPVVRTFALLLPGEVSLELRCREISGDMEWLDAQTVGLAWDTSHTYVAT